jgi:predicted nucleotidyltransferase
MNPEESRSAIVGYLERSNVKGTVLFSMVTGSHCYNLASGSSDIDYVGVYLANTDEFLSACNKLPKEALVTQAHNVDEPNDINAYEAKQYLKLLAEGNLLYQVMNLIN